MPDLLGITLMEVKYEFNIAMLHISLPLHPQVYVFFLVLAAIQIKYPMSMVSDFSQDSLNLNFINGIYC